MARITPTLPNPGVTARGDGESLLLSAISAILAELNGNIDATNVVAGFGSIADDSLIAQKLDPATVRAILGLNATGQVRRGKAIIPATETLTAPVAYAFAATPDRVQNVILPTDGLIRVRYHATWQESVTNASDAAIFIGANQLAVPTRSVPATPQVESAMIGAGGPNVDTPLETVPWGLVSVAAGGASDLATGQALALGSSNAAGGEVRWRYNNNVGNTGIVGLFVGGVCEIFAAAGTYDVGVKFRATSGNVTVKNRKLWVEAISFG